ncbi:MAG: hypothetical protein A2268_12655 [Candidatus Raymondbacteria bacterium RifOxyA12_full_50_37]|uniref:Transcriptional regulator n=1 Tax=Candidatus Raymondbacteria bacterium RIFOXYD12_FULL_49_13 TaxID=1817890 RepID=A0A1F7FB52_UNCRA|nr:MAG: hypothetical protein A2268_12655 [Candidatus Raymondbacteria bacterium RifOxyA12_full_50_37]OGJ91026.1 MAG: hypothetical protein A2248_00675 [Candidatus Raymondbacteria bacterium RIFOXYA2_FULL_49_16]OGJ97463.1 MAG: hypothetical protein A2453_10225 [Candidatus Raymondbacteria bacterium RIFOXYC2_FULL_50_21]OGJ97791.1 MAG: hypothetical protein A2487_13240 [Candidatus Raymondbacteria bacterium RifOxyC12_full_50_8]OGJ99727.1 MAG: hypothetical protein A2350_08930 [Candidatus Raymondbacteria b
MPSVCEFFGISIYFYFSEHMPPHFHANYGEYWAEFDFHGTILKGKFPPRVAGFVTEWALSRQEELGENWKRARLKKILKKIKPLE